MKLLCTRAIIIFALCLPLTGFCGAAQNNSKTVALVMKELSNPFFNKMEQGAKAYAGDNDISLEVFGLQYPTDVAHQISILENLISRNYGAIVIAPVDSERLIPVCKKAIKNGIVVINIDNPLNHETLAAQGLSIPFVGSDNRAGAKMVGEYIKRKMNHKGNLIFIEGIRGVKNAELRKKGVIETVTRNSKIKILASEPANWNMEQAFSLTMKLLETFPQVDGIVCANDKMALGAIQAVDLLNRKNIWVAGYDNIESVRNAIRNNKMHATMEQHPELMGEFGVMLASKKLNHRPIPDHMSTPLDLITHESFNKKVGFSVSTLDNPFFSLMVKGAKEAARLYGMELIIKNAENNNSTQLMDIVALNNLGVDAMIINPTHAETIVPGVDMATSNQIPVITVDRKISRGNILSHVASDNIQGGQIAAQIIADHLNQKGNIIEIEGIPGTSAAHDRGLGFNEALKNYPGITVVAREVAGFNRDNAKQVMERILHRGIQFDAVFAHNDTMILGVMDALGAGQTPSKILVGFDAVREAVRSVKENKITATIAQQPRLMGRLSVQTAAMVFRKDKINDYIPVSLSPITSSNAP